MTSDVTGQSTALSAAAIAEHRTALAEAAVVDDYSRRGAYLERYGPRGRARYLEDTAYHLSFLAQALRSASPALFTDYIAWVKVLLVHLGIPTDDLVENLQCVCRALRNTLPPELAAVACAYVEGGLDQLPQLPDELQTYLAETQPLAPLAHDYLQALLRGERATAARLIHDAVDSGISVKEIYLRVFQSTQYEIGRLWQLNQLTVAQEHYCSAVTQSIMSQLHTQIFATARSGPTFVAACVQGELHEIGMRIVADCLEMEGWDTFYLGANTPTAGIVETVVQRRAAVLGLSATMTFHVDAVAHVIEAIRSNDACRAVKILVGGYPFRVAGNLWQTVGADGCGLTATEAVGVANRMVRADPVT